MSLLLDALHRASKDKERAALAAAAASVASSTDEGKVRLDQPLELSADFPTLVLAKEAPSMELVEPPAPSPAASKPVALELEMLPQTVVAVQPERDSLVLETPQADPIGTSAPIAPLAAVAAPPQPAVSRDTILDIGSVSGASPSFAKTPKISAPAAQAAASAIQGAYVSSPAVKRPGRRVLVLGGVAACLALGLGSLLMGLWGDPEKLFGLTGGSSITAAQPPLPAREPEPAASSVAVAPVAPAVSAVPAASAASPALPIVPATSPAVAASAPLATAMVDKPSAPLPKEVTLRTPPVAPVFTARVTSQGALEEAYSALLEGRIDEATRAYGVALDANPLERDALLGLAYIAHTKGRREEAQAYYAKVLRLEPHNTVANAGMLALGAGANGVGNGERAKELAARQPDSAALQALAASALVQDGLLAEAALGFSRAQELEPTNPWHSYNLAVALDKLGNSAQALAQYQKALTNQVRSPTPLRPQQVESARARASQLGQSLATPLGIQK
jgi:tetratricopeptide (TPR) repeat protein